MTMSGRADQQMVSCCSANRAATVNHSHRCALKDCNILNQTSSEGPGCHV